jgi:hypothetical protein
VAFLIDQGIEVVKYLKETTDIRYCNAKNFRYLLEWCMKQGIDLNECIGGKTFDGN